MSQYNLRYVPTLSTDLFILNGQRFNTQAAAILANGNIINTPALSTEVIINDATKNQALFAGLVELQGEVIGNVNPPETIFIKIDDWELSYQYGSGQKN